MTYGKFSAKKVIKACDAEIDFWDNADYVSPLTQETLKGVTKLRLFATALPAWEDTIYLSIEDFQLIQGSLKH